MASPTTATTTTATIDMDGRSLDPQDRMSGIHHSSQAVAREALGASEKLHPSDTMALSPDQTQVHSYPNPGNQDTYSPPPTDNNGNAATATSLNAPTTFVSPGPMEESTSQDGD